ncbi:MAG: hypothetical protein MUC49_12965 [Raineya sp.]|jgi:hypothetical protein|nr:hypothetical protein [Raineya sp.]
MKNKVEFNLDNPNTIKEFLISHTTPWVYNPDEEHNEDFASFFFLGTYKNQDVVFIVIFITLGVHYSMTIEDTVEEEIRKLYPEYDGKDSKLPNNKMEAILEHKAEIKGKLLLEKNIKVQEFIDFDDDFEGGDQIVILKVALNINEVNEEEIDKFVKSFQNNTFKLDETSYSFRPIR